tara:strand:- start:4 stop:270 length:267 start_codon:yes stop_codon:yes gene_type:complete
MLTGCVRIDMLPAFIDRMPFATEQPDLAIEAAGVAGQGAAATDDAMTRNHDGDRVARVGQAHSPCGPGLAQCRCYFAVTSGLAGRNRL